ncbi:PQQ-binding-like beta-propeller repeat protein [Halolamina litorea]|uniref:PQQ-binding-like beta-propeller repeat protein n=1 Tax=Halolamina litorea TaxID=1515593 RepID=A0ABD6BRH9_9EURY
MAKQDKPDIEETEPIAERLDATFQAEAPGSDVTAEQLAADDDDPTSWLQYNKGYKQRGYSPAARITPENADELTSEFTLTLGGAQQTPIVVPSGEGEDPVMYVPEGQNVTALNARTGDVYWTHKHELVYEPNIVRNQRGLTVWQDKIIYTASDLRLIALNRYTGEELWRTHAVSERQKELMEPSTERLTNSGAPLVYDGVILKGQSGEGGNWSAFMAFDAETGEKLWDYNVIPPEYWIDETWRFGDGAPWTTPSVDPQSGTVFFTTGNPSPQINGVVRPGPNKHSDSLVAVDIETGEEKWTHQFTAHDWWDYDAYLSHVFDMEIDGETRRVVGAKDKTGWTYVVDAETGRLLRRSEPHGQQGAQLPMFALPPASEEEAKEQAPTAMGATDWHPSGYSPETGLYYVDSNDDFWAPYYNPDWEFRPDSLDHSVGGTKAFPIPSEYAERATRVSAIDPDSGEVVWTQSYEAAPFQFAGGNTPTGGNVVFSGASTGTFRVMNAETGEILHEREWNSMRTAPITWDVPSENKQYVAATGGSSEGTVLEVFSVEAEMTEETETPAETETATEEPTEAATETDAATDTATATDAEETTSTEGPGFGAAAAATGVAGAAAAAKKRSDSDDESDEE